MAREPRNYDSLRESHQQALDALNAHIEQGQQPENIQQAAREAAHEVTARSTSEPERPEGHYGDRPGWTDRGDMVSQQTSARAMAEDRNAQLQEQHAAARDALDQHMQGGGSQTPEQSQNQDIGRKPDDIER